MTKQRTKADFTGQSIYVGLDVHVKSWSVSIHVGEIEHKTFNQPPDANVLSKYLHRNFPGAEYYCVYEAGYCGFGAYRDLNALGINCIVVNPIDVPTTNKERKNRRDLVDARKLARALRNHELIPIYVPGHGPESDRGFVRGRKDTIVKRTRVKNQIKGYLRYFSIRTPDELVRANWSAKYIEWLSNLNFEFQSARDRLDTMLHELRSYNEQLTIQNQQLKRLSSEEKYKGDVELLRTVPGIGRTAAMVLLTEIVDIHRFKGCDQLASFAGLVPDQQSSGDTEGAPQLTRRRNPHLRGVLIECAWIAIRQDPALTLAYQKLTKGMKPQRAIIRVARKLLNRIRYVLMHQEPYVIGVVQ